MDICTDSSTISRIIFFPTDAVEQLSDALQTNEAYRAIWYQLPDYVENTLYLDSDYNLSQADLTEILESYQAERLSCDFDTLFTQSDDTSDEYQTLTYTFQNGGSSALLECVLSEKLTPNTLQLVYDKISTSQVENVENLVENIACKNPNIYYTFSANAYDYSVRMDSEQYRLNMDGDLDGAIAADQDLLQLFWSYVDLDASLTVGEPKVVIYAYDAENGIDTSMLLPIDTAVFADDTITESNAFSLYYYNESAGYIFIK